MKIAEFIAELANDQEQSSVIYFDESKEEAVMQDKESFIESFRQQFVDEEVKEAKKELKSKMDIGSTQSSSEIGKSSSSRSVRDSLFGRIASMPYDPYCIKEILRVNEVHTRACKVKSRDSVGRKYSIKPRFPLLKEDQQDNKVKLGDHGDAISIEDFNKDCKLVKDFIQNCNKQKTFRQLCYLVSMDQESIGWGAFEVIRRRDGKVARLKWVPAENIRVLEDWEGFVEINRDVSFRGHSYTYYQPFGEKIKATEEDLLDISSNPRRVKVDYSPEEHGELNVLTNNKLTWNLKSRITGKEIDTTPANFTKEAANEIIFLAKDSTLSRYYGTSDIEPAVNSVEAIVSINRYRNEFFANNCVPRWAVVMKGAKISPQFQADMEKYFEKNIKGKTGKTLILALSTLGNKNVDVDFVRLDADQKEADFLETKKSYNQDIMTAHGVSASLLAINETATLGSGRGGAQSEQYKDRTVVPAQILWASKLNELFRLGLGAVNACIEFDPLDVKDELQTAQVLNLMVATGLLGVNEAREKIGLQPVEGGDQQFVRSGEDKITLIRDLGRDLGLTDTDMSDSEADVFRQISEMQKQNNQLSETNDPTKHGV